MARAEGFLAGAIHHQHGKGKPAVVFDIDDTLLNTYDYEIANQFGFTPASNAVFFITGRPQTQTDATINNLVSAGYAKPAAGHLFLKPSTPPSYLHCVNAPTCTKIEYKSGTRAYRQRGLLDHGGLRRPVQ